MEDINSICKCMKIVHIRLMILFVSLRLDLLHSVSFFLQGEKIPEVTGGASADAAATPKAEAASDDF